MPRFPGPGERGAPSVGLETAGVGEAGAVVADLGQDPGSGQGGEAGHAGDDGRVRMFGEALREVYLKRGLAPRVFTWHEAADTALFQPHRRIEKDCDLIWIGNWGDDERTAELHDEFRQCPECRRVYWKGGHYERMRELVEKLSGER